MDNFYIEHWKEKKRLRREDDTPVTSLDVLMQKIGVRPTQLLGEEIRDQIPVSPGSLIQAVLDDLQLTQSELAEQMGVTRTAIHLWIHGQRALSVENALSLECYLGIPAHILLRLQIDYQLYHARRHNMAVDSVPRHSTL